MYVVPFPGRGPKSQVSTTGGWLARFSRKELFYATLANRLMVAEIHTEPSFGVGSVRSLFQLDFPNWTNSAPLYLAKVLIGQTESSPIVLQTGARP